MLLYLLPLLFLISPVSAEGVPHLKVIIMICKVADRHVCRDVEEIVHDDYAPANSAADCMRGGMGFGSQLYEMNGEQWFSSFRCSMETDGPTSSLDKQLHAGD